MNIIALIVTIIFVAIVILALFNNKVFAICMWTLFMGVSTFLIYMLYVIFDTTLTAIFR